MMANIVKISDCSAAEFDEIVEIYNNSFPIEERHSVERIKERIDSGKEETFCLKSDSEVIGIFLIWNLNLQNYYVLDYYAIKQSKRGLGYGTYFLEELIKLFERADGKIIIEIEDYIPEQINDNKTQRAKFYRNLGFLEVQNYDYTMPSIENKPEVKMRLMISSMKDKKSLSADELKSIIAALYLQMYYLDKNSTFFAQILDCINTDYHLG